MDYSKTSITAMSESPFALRPGTICDVEITYIVKEELEWDTSIVFTDDFEGLVVEESIKSDSDISAAVITIDEEDDIYIVTIQPLDIGVITLEIYKYAKVDAEVTAISAFTESYVTYYQDYIISNNCIVPATIVNFNDIIESLDIYRIEVVKVTPRITNNGIDYINGDPIHINNAGLLEYLTTRVNILRKGMQKVLVPLDFDGPSVSVQNGQKLIEFENQEWQSGFTDSRGILVYNSYLLILCDSGLCVFSIYGDFKDYLLCDSLISGNDLTYYPDDSIGVANGSQIDKYKLRHDFSLIDIENKRIYFRELDPRFTIVGL